MATAMTMASDRHAMEAVSRELQRVARDLDADLAEVAGERVAFSLFVWTEGRCSYVSSGAMRSEVIVVLEAMIARWKAGEPDVPAHEAREQ